MLRAQSLWGAGSLDKKKPERDVQWDLTLLCLKPLVSVHHIIRSRISPGSSHSPGTDAPQVRV